MQWGRTNPNTRKLQNNHHVQQANVTLGRKLNQNPNKINTEGNERYLEEK